jgi:hypothetical protein
MPRARSVPLPLPLPLPQRACGRVGRTRRPCGSPAARPLSVPSQQLNKVASTQRASAPPCTPCPPCGQLSRRRGPPDRARTEAQRERQRRRALQLGWISLDFSLALGLAPAEFFRRRGRISITAGGELSCQKERSNYPLPATHCTRPSPTLARSTHPLNMA